MFPHAFALPLEVLSHTQFIVDSQKTLRGHTMLQHALLHL